MKRPFRITIEQYDNKTIVEYPASDLSIEEVMELFQRALLGSGFEPQTIQKYFTNF